MRLLLLILLPTLQFWSALAPCGDASTCKIAVENLTFDPSRADGEGLVAVAPVTAQNVLTAYRAGAFPWTQVGELTGWYSVDPRGVLDFDSVHISKSLKKEKARLVKSGAYRFAIDENFRKVVEGCADAVRPVGGTWISQRIIDEYTELYKMGYAHSFEVYIDGELAGGAYGVFWDGRFSGESMFYRVSNAGKLAFWEMIEYLKSRGLSWMDTQVVTDGTRPFGAKEISRSEYLERLQNKAHFTFR